MDLSLVELSQMALHAGMDVGFNAVEIERWCDPETFDLKIVFTFGEREQMRKPRLRTPCEWALSYTEECSCIRAARQIEVPLSLVERPTDEIRVYLVEHLLEVVN